MANVGDKGTYQGNSVEVVAVHEDAGTLDLQKIWPDGTPENLPKYWGILAREFTTPEPVPVPDPIDGEGGPVDPEPAVTTPDPEPLPEEPEGAPDEPPAKE